MENQALEQGGPLGLHRVSSIGAFIVACGFLIVAGNLLHSLFRGRKAPANPWGGASLDWYCSSPPSHENFATPPPVADPYDFSVLTYDDVHKGYVWKEEKGDAEPGITADSGGSESGKG